MRIFQRNKTILNISYNIEKLEISKNEIFTLSMNQKIDKKWLYFLSIDEKKKFHFNKMRYKSILKQHILI